MKPLRTLLPACLLFFSACNILDGNDVQDDLRDRQRRWIALGIDSYTFDFQRSCFCAGPVEPLRIVVRNDSIISVTLVSTNAPPQNLPDGWVRTINGVFIELIETAEGADDVDVAYSREYHFPASAAVDRIKNAIDDEFNLSLSNFQPNR